MPRKKYEYSTVENVNTLRLAINFEKLYLIDVVDEAYYVLLSKGKKKAAYIQKALTHYDKNIERNNIMNDSLRRFRIASIAKKIFRIDTEDDARKILSLSPDSKEYRIYQNSIPEKKTPSKMLCGFKIDDPEAINMHTRLFELSVNERVLLISKAVVGYVLDGCDPEMENIFATKFLISAINEYYSSENKSAVLNNFMIAINCISS